MASSDRVLTICTGPSFEDSVCKEAEREMRERGREEREVREGEERGR
jgi:hypothetical protein